MTGKIVRNHKRMAAASFSVILLFFIFLLLRNPTVAIECGKQGLSLCTKAIIPSLFPFMVLSELLIACGFGDFFGRRLGSPLASLFGISRESTASVFLGFLCGFPVGARVAVNLYERGKIDKNECERLLGFSNLPSVAFLVSTVGVSLYQSHAFGILLWFSSMTSAVIVGIVTRKKEAPTKKASSFVVPSLNFSTFTSAIAHASGAMLSICAYIIFFGAVLGCLSYILAELSLPTALNALLYGFFELSSGVSTAASLSDRLFSAVICGLTVGWSGLSIHCQLITLCDGRDLSYRFYFLARFAEALICALLVLIFFPFCF